MKKPGTSEPFVKHERALLESFAWRALSGDGRKVLDRIELEHLKHGGRDNGRLIVTYGDFIAYGISERRNVSHGLREVEALGLLEIKRGSNGDIRAANLYRLTYLPAGNQAATSEWRRFKTIEEAKAQLSGMKKSRSRSRLFSIASKGLPQ
jgi:hypothetical protein